MRMGGLGAVLLAVCLLASVKAQELPKATAEGQKVVAELVKACLAERVLTHVKEGKKVSIRVDARKVRAIVAARRKQLTREVGDTLVAKWGRTTPVGQVGYVALLEAVGEETRDERLLGFAAFFTALSRAQRREEGAQASYERAVKHFAAARELAWQATSLNNLGLLLKDRGKYGQALPYLQQALAMDQKLYPAAQFPLGHPDLAQSLNNLGGLLWDQGEYVKALPYLQQALAMDQKLYPVAKYPNGHPNLARSLNNLGLLLQAQGEYGKALPYMQQALAMFQKLYPVARFPHGHPQLARSLNNLGWVLRAQGEYGKALTAYNEALQSLRLSDTKVSLDGDLAVAKLLRPVPWTVRILGNRADLLAASLRPRASVEQLRRCNSACALALAVQERLRSEFLTHHDSKLRLGEEHTWLVPLRLAMLARLFALEGKAADLRTAFTTLEQNRARVFLESLGKAHAGRLASLPPKLRAEEEGLNRALRLLDAQLRTIEKLPRAEVAARTRQLWQERQQAEEKLSRFEQQLARSQPHYAALRYPRPCSLEQARACLEASEVALLFSVGREASYVLVVAGKPDPKDKAQGLALVRLPGRSVLAEQIETLRQNTTLTSVQQTRDAGSQLYRLLLAPLEKHIKGKNLVIVPDGPLGLLPFELLVEGASVEEEGRWLIQTRRLRYAPSLTALHLIGLWEKGRTVKPDRPLWALGDPVFGLDDPRLLKPALALDCLAGPGGSGLLASGLLAATLPPDSREVRRDLLLRSGRPGEKGLVRLPASGQEVQRVAGLLKAPRGLLRLGREATEAAVKQASARGELGRARYVHFATHGILGSRDGLPAALALCPVGASGQQDEYGADDGLLRLPEVSALRLNADLVVLSACQTGQGSQRGAEGVASLARVFFYAGSRGVVCSLWKVADRGTAELMAAMYQRLEKGQSSAEALRGAKLALIEAGELPFVWAPFIHLGR
jgi:CHAT domain-containing protein/Tfp pilus assembly protein PilF